MNSYMSDYQESIIKKLDEKHQLVETLVKSLKALQK